MSLKRSLSFLDVFCIASGAMISSGIFILPALAYARVGPAMVVSYLIAGVLALLGILSVAELSTAMPRAGGDYYFVTRSLGPLMGTVAGLLGWFALSLKTAFAIFGIAEVIHLVSGGALPVFGVSAVVCVLFVFLNIWGVDVAAKLEVWLVFALLSLMAVFFIAGAPHVEATNLHPFLAEGADRWTVLATAGFVFVSFGGLLKVASMAEEVKNPKRNMPLAFISSVICITGLYVAMLWVTSGVLPGSELRGSMSPIADAAKSFWGRGGYILITVAAMLAFLTTANAGIMAASRYPLALSRDRLIPPFAGRVGKRQTPTAAVIITGTFILGSLLLDLELLVKAASAVVLAAYVLSNLAVLILRQSRIENYRPSFKVPLYPVLPIFGVIVFSVLVLSMGLATILMSIGFVAVAVVVYLAYGRRHADQQYALLYLLERITNKELSDYSLESELRTVLHERDEVIHDVIDTVFDRAVVLDYDEEVGCERLFYDAGQALAKPLKMEPAEVESLLKEREEESSTVLAPLVAVPHLIVPGDDSFEVLVVRGREGINFPEEGAAVKAAFIIAGSRNKRSLHLKALAAIAHITQHPEFKDRWLSARNEQGMRDILLLSERNRGAPFAADTQR